MIPWWEGAASAGLLLGGVQVSCPAVVLGPWWGISLDLVLALVLRPVSRAVSRSYPVMSRCSRESGCSRWGAGPKGNVPRLSACRRPGTLLMDGVGPPW